MSDDVMFYLKVGGLIVAVSDNEDDLVNHAATLDSDYEILEWEDLSQSDLQLIKDNPPEEL